MAFANEFSLAGQKLDFATRTQIHAMTDFDQLFRWHCNERNIATKRRRNITTDDAHGRAQHAGYLSVMATRMRCTRGRIGKRMIRDSQTIELTYQRKCRAIVAGL